ncbi:hypothetical protein BX265_6130 [Streptomyces sp. TLI_235]|nr:hypothetical protein [Streptomyces sp. TLI_235]PBC71520.1 hypothetical protein BX265_6130 [Streptomyces sp. TLI_235]
MQQPNPIFPPPEESGPLNAIARLQSGFGLAGIVVTGVYGPEVHVDTVAELDAWFGWFGIGSSMSVGSRQEERDGQLWGLGGLDWTLRLYRLPGIGGLTVRLTTGEGEELPDCPAVRRGWPFDLERADRERSRAAAGPARQAVAS